MWTLDAPAASWLLVHTPTAQPQGALIMPWQPEDLYLFGWLQQAGQEPSLTGNIACWPRGAEVACCMHGYGMMTAFVGGTGDESSASVCHAMTC
jgi:hypothetical protein